MSLGRSIGRELQEHNFAEQRVLFNLVDSAIRFFGDPGGSFARLVVDAVRAHLSEELDWSVAELGTSAEVDLLRFVILRIRDQSRVRAQCVLTLGYAARNPWCLSGVLRAGHLVCSHILWKDLMQCTDLELRVAGAADRHDRHGATSSCVERFVSAGFRRTQRHG